MSLRRAFRTILDIANGTPTPMLRCLQDNAAMLEEMLEWRHYPPITITSDREGRIRLEIVRHAIALAQGVRQYRTIAAQSDAVAAAQSVTVAAIEQYASRLVMYTRLLYNGCAKNLGQDELPNAT